MEKKEVESRAKEILKSLELQEKTILDFQYYRTTNRLEIYLIIGSVLPATEKMIFLKLRHKLGRMEWLSKRDIECLITEKLIKKRKELYYITPEFNNYINGLWKNIQNYKYNRNFDFDLVFSELEEKIKKYEEEKQKK